MPYLYNKVLTNIEREQFKPLIDEMFEVAPEMMSRKIPEANVQQAFVLDTIQTLFNHRKESIKLLCVGSFEDTASEVLKHKGWNVTEIDPVLNMDLATFCNVNSELFDVVFATSVIEHVRDDETFLRQMCQKLIDGGCGILTCDFKDNFLYGDTVPATSIRFYTANDLRKRFRKILKEESCFHLDDPDYSADPDFIYQGHLYSFATLTFIKNLE
jgi:SAM-dependent methyltransferase